eukprot:TRINITY_DN54224_c0_g1_i1.p1 TRINITY_DN54224_c0_g1~~TRINITY_DN54224_c0_g1_i1.p1  ORF type:complete len:753 (-),score=128.35 TRINITY_DN54224_c0_g1_i1:127-2385(-)
MAAAGVPPVSGKAWTRRLGSLSLLVGAPLARASAEGLAVRSIPTMIRSCTDESSRFLRITSSEFECASLVAEDDDCILPNNVMPAVGIFNPHLSECWCCMALDGQVLNASQDWTYFQLVALKGWRDLGEDVCCCGEAGSPQLGALSSTSSPSQSLTACQSTCLTQIDCGYVVFGHHSRTCTPISSLAACYSMVNSSKDTTCQTGSREAGVEASCLRTPAGARVYYAEPEKAPDSGLDFSGPAISEKSLVELCEFLLRQLENASVHLWRLLDIVLRLLGRTFAVMALLLLPFGQKRPRCNHHARSMFNTLRAACLGPHPCRGECVVVSGYSFRLFLDDAAWTIWCIELGVWSYVVVLTFAFSLYGLGLLLYTALSSVLILSLQLLLLLCCCFRVCVVSMGQVLLPGIRYFIFVGIKSFGTVFFGLGYLLRQTSSEIVAIGRACGLAGAHHLHLRPRRQRSGLGGEGAGREAADAAGNMDASLSSPLMRSNSAETAATAAAASPASPRLPSNNDVNVGEVQAGNQEPEETLRIGGPHLEDGRGHDEGSVCGPVMLWVLSLAPIAPENAWGGLVGSYLGTHPLKNTYAGGSRVAELLRMGWRRPADLTELDLEDATWSLEGWRSFVRATLEEASRGSHLLRAESLPMRTAAGARVGEADGGLLPRHYFNVIEESDGGRRSFTEDDRLYNWEQYVENECWICCSSNDTWDLWVSCRHAFCRQCSDQMVRRLMPCPLCRTISTVLRRRAAYKGEAHS